MTEYKTEERKPYEMLVESMLTKPFMDPRAGMVSEDIGEAVMRLAEDPKFLDDPRKSLSGKLIQVGMKFYSMAQGVSDSRYMERDDIKLMIKYLGFAMTACEVAKSGDINNDEAEELSLLKGVVTKEYDGLLADLVGKSSMHEPTEDSGGEPLEQSSEACLF